MAVQPPISREYERITPTSDCQRIIARQVGPVMHQFVSIIAEPVSKISHHVPRRGLPASIVPRTFMRRVLVIARRGVQADWVGGRKLHPVVLSALYACAGPLVAIKETELGWISRRSSHKRAKWSIQSIHPKMWGWAESVLEQVLMGNEDERALSSAVVFRACGLCGLQLPPDGRG